MSRGVWLRIRDEAGANALPPGATRATVARERARSALAGRAGKARMLPPGM